MAASELVERPLNRQVRPGVRWTLAFFCIAVFALLALQVVQHGPVTHVDEEVSRYFALHRVGLLTQAMRIVSAMHQTVAVLAATALVALVLGRRKAWHSLRGLLAVPLAMVLNVGLKDTFLRPRPHWDTPIVHLPTYSFPSGHALASTVFYGVLCALVFAHTRSRLRRGAVAGIAVVMVPLVCFSRVYLGAHYPSDVIAGVAEGTLCVLLFLSWVR